MDLGGKEVVGGEGEVPTPPKAGLVAVTDQRDLDGGSDVAGS